MEFKEVEREPEFTLKLSLKEVIELWHIVSNSVSKGNENARAFREALHDFAENSNRYNEWLD